MPFNLGSESKAETGEAHADDVADPTAIQSFTFCFVVEFVPGGKFTGAKPEDYEKLRDGQPFKLFTPGGEIF